jgi:NAD(P) transhydrogenase subunit alpha
MRIAVLKETAERERRVALTPDAVKRLAGAGHEVLVERGAGEAAYFPDALYEQAGARVAPSAGDAARGAQLVAKVQRPRPDEAACLDEGSALVSLLQPPVGTAFADDASVRALAGRRVTAFALERVPRITRAQSMDVLSSQATVAGYKAVLLGASHLARLMPMLTTAAGSIPPAKALVIGAGVAGLQAIATARRLGAVVSAFDVRAAAREQVQSLGATFVAAELVSAGAEAAGGYAREQTAEERAAVADALAAHAKDMDLVVCTAAVPGRPAPRILTEATVRAMRPGAVVVDLAAETGGNCALTRPGETVDAGGVLVLGPLNVPSTLPYHASMMLGRNVLTFAQHLAKDGALVVDLADEITGAMAVTTTAGARSAEPPRPAPPPHPNPPRRPWPRA